LVYVTSALFKKRLKFITVNSLDPRVQRLPKIGQPGQVLPKAPLDQFGTFEVFVQPKDGKPFQHEGAVHAPNLEMAYILAKETFTRRFTCVSLYVADTRNVSVSPMSEGNTNAYDLLEETSGPAAEPTSYEVYHLVKRGKQHVHAGNVVATGAADAMRKAATTLKGDKLVYNIWVIRTQDIRFTSDDEKDLWTTLPEKKFRDATEYKGGDKLKTFLENNQQ
jgi:ring-1,2-phenylacetyl-CoA epoxidase subunit PaaB